METEIEIGISTSIINTTTIITNKKSQNTTNHKNTNNGFTDKVWSSIKQNQTIVIICLCVIILCCSWIICVGFLCHFNSLLAKQTELDLAQKTQAGSQSSAPSTTLVSQLSHSKSRSKSNTRSRSNLPSHSHLSHNSHQSHHRHSRSSPHQQHLHVTPHPSNNHSPSTSHNVNTKTSPHGYRTKSDGDIETLALDNKKSMSSGIGTRKPHSNLRLAMQPIQTNTSDDEIYYSTRIPYHSQHNPVNSGDDYVSINLNNPHLKSPTTTYPPPPPLIYNNYTTRYQPNAQTISTALNNINNNNIPNNNNNNIYFHHNINSVNNTNGNNNYKQEIPDYSPTISKIDPNTKIFPSNHRKKVVVNLTNIDLNQGNVDLVVKLPQMPNSEAIRSTDIDGTPILIYSDNNNESQTNQSPINSSVHSSRHSPMHSPIHSPIHSPTPTNPTMMPMIIPTIPQQNLIQNQIRQPPPISDTIIYDNNINMNTPRMSDVNGKKTILEVLHDIQKQKQLESQSIPKNQEKILRLSITETASKQQNGDILAYSASPKRIPLLLSGESDEFSRLNQTSLNNTNNTVSNETNQTNGTTTKSSDNIKMISPYFVSSTDLNLTSSSTNLGNNTISTDTNIYNDHNEDTDSIRAMDGDTISQRSSFANYNFNNFPLRNIHNPQSLSYQHPPIPQYYQQNRQISQMPQIVQNSQNVQNTQNVQQSQNVQNSQNDANQQRLGISNIQQIQQITTLQPIPQSVQLEQSERLEQSENNTQNENENDNDNESVSETENKQSEKPIINHKDDRFSTFQSFSSSYIQIRAPPELKNINVPKKQPLQSLTVDTSIEPGTMTSDEDQTRTRTNTTNTNTTNTYTNTMTMSNTTNTNTDTNTNTTYTMDGFVMLNYATHRPPNGNTINRNDPSTTTLSNTNTNTSNTTYASNTNNSNNTEVTNTNNETETKYNDEQDQYSTTDTRTGVTPAYTPIPSSPASLVNNYQLKPVLKGRKEKRFVKNAKNNNEKSKSNTHDYDNDNDIENENENDVEENDYDNDEKSDQSDTNINLTNQKSDTRQSSVL